MPRLVAHARPGQAPGLGLGPVGFGALRVWRLFCVAAAARLSRCGVPASALGQRPGKIPPAPNLLGPERRRRRRRPRRLAGFPAGAVSAAAAFATRVRALFAPPPARRRVERRRRRGAAAAARGKGRPRAGRPARGKGSRDVGWVFGRLRTPRRRLASPSRLVFGSGVAAGLRAILLLRRGARGEAKDDCAEQRPRRLKERLRAVDGSIFTVGGRRLGGGRRRRGAAGLGVPRHCAVQRRWDFDVDASTAGPPLPLPPPRLHPARRRRLHVPRAPHARLGAREAKAATRHGRVLRLCGGPSRRILTSWLEHACAPRDARRPLPRSSPPPPRRPRLATNAVGRVAHFVPGPAGAVRRRGDVARRGRLGAV
mmetsp:Transcript_25861/g.88901  ORF Transcript_25861/g.88901 Transcript_25861/m.88901 type:complete len:369 (-) Transcript_25861:549-1655(-)